MMIHEDLILEAAHSYMVYMSLVPNARLLKWADVMLQAANILSIDASESYGNDSDKVKRAHLTALLTKDIKNITYEPIYAIANSVKMRLNQPDVYLKDPDMIFARTSLEACCARSEERKIQEDIDIIGVKNELISNINRAFGILNKIQGHKYPEIKTRKEMVG